MWKNIKLNADDKSLQYFDVLIDKNYKIQPLYDIKEKLNETKSQLDIIFQEDTKTYEFITNKLDPLKAHKYEIVSRTNAEHVSNAWLKCYEILNHYDEFIMPKKYDTETNYNSFIVFCNAELPGSFIYAINHYISTRTKIKPHEWKWFANSKLPTTNIQKNKNEKENILYDEYGLAEKYPQRWLMLQFENDGDVTDPEVQEKIQTFFKEKNNKVDLYTSDLGFDVSVDFNKQETLHAHANLGQIFSALITLKEGGTMIVKMFTFFETFTVTLIGILTTLFERFEIAKPVASKEGNSEIYLIGIGYKESLANDCKNILWNRLKSFSMFPLLKKESIDHDFLKSIITIHKNLSNLQIEKIQFNIKIYEKYKKKERMTMQDNEVQQYRTKKIQEFQKSVKVIFRLDSNFNLDNNTMRQENKNNYCLIDRPFFYIKRQKIKETKNRFQNQNNNYKNEILINDLLKIIEKYKKIY